VFETQYMLERRSNLQRASVQEDIEKEVYEWNA
jgi:hypothetical protein